MRARGCAGPRARYACNVSPLLVAAALVTVAAVVGVLVLRARRRRRAPRPVREPSAFVILDGNAWDACNVDDVREPWGRFTTEPVRGFCGVASGRHRIRTATPVGDATLDFVVYPGEVLAWRLDAERARWEPHDLDGETRALLEGAPLSTRDLGGAPHTKLPGWLVHLRTTVGMASARSSGRLPSDGGDAIDRVRDRFAKLVGRAEHEAEGAASDSLVEARGLGETLIGRHLTREQLRALVAPAREVASRLVSHGDSERAMRVVGLGLAVLPGDPELMVVAGCALAARGEADEAMRALAAALERDRCLEAEDVARAMRARMDLRSRPLRSVRVS